MGVQPEDTARYSKSHQETRMYRVLRVLCLSAEREESVQEENGGANQNSPVILFCRGNLYFCIILVSGTFRYLVNAPVALPNTQFGYIRFGN